MTRYRPGTPLFPFWALAALLLWATAANAAPARWTLQEIGTFGSMASTPFALNNRGQVVGVSHKAVPGYGGEISRCFLWENGTLSDIQIPTGASGATATTRLGITANLNA